MAGAFVRLSGFLECRLTTGFGNSAYGTVNPERVTKKTVVEMTCSDV